MVFTSDHGEGLGDHEIAAKPMMPYECVNRVPAMWKDPSVAFGSAYAGGESAQRVIAVSSISETSEYPVPIGVFHA